MTLSVKSLNIVHIAIAMFFLISSFGYVDAQDTNKLIKERINLVMDMTVTRDGSTLPFNQVPVVKQGDKLKLRAPFEDSFKNAGFNVLVAIFIPIRSLDPVLANNSLVVSARKLKKCNPQDKHCDSDETDDQKQCALNCTFIVPSYDSIPLFFLVSKNDSWTQNLGGNSAKERLKDLVTQQHSQFINYSGDSFSYTLTPKKVNFLADLDRIMKTPAASNGKVLQNLYRTAITYLELDPKNECANTETVFNKMAAKQLRCIVEKNAGVLQAISLSPDLKNKLDWRTITLQIAEIAVQQLKFKFPKLDGYLAIASAIMDLMQPLLNKWFGGEPIVITSAIATQIENSNGYQFFAIRDKTPTQNNPSGGFRNAVFFVPFRVYEDGVPPGINATDLNSISPTLPCLGNQDNGFTMPSTLTSNTRATSILLNLFDSNEAPISGVSPMDIPVDSVKTVALLNFQSSVFDRLVQAGTVKARLDFRYNFASYSSPIFILGVSKPQNWGIDTQPDNKMRLGSRNRLRITAPSAQCLEKIQFKDSLGKVTEILSSVQQVVSEDVNNPNSAKILPIQGLPNQLEIAFEKDAFEQMASGPGVLSIFQYGQKQQDLKINIQPRILADSIIYVPGDSFATLQFPTNVSQQILSDTQIVHVEIDGNPNYIFDFPRRTINGININTLKNNSKISLITRDGEKILIQPTLKKLSARIKFETSECSTDVSDNEVGAEWTDTRFEGFDPCSVIPSDVSRVKFNFSSPDTTYDFAQRQPRVVSWLENTTKGSSSQTGVCQLNDDVAITHVGLSSDAFGLSAEINLTDPNVRSLLTCPGWKLKVKLVENVSNNESEIMALYQAFVALPQNVKFTCAGAGEKPCKLSADGNTYKAIQKISVNGDGDANFEKFEKDKLYTRPADSSSVWIMLRNNMKLNLKSGAIQLQ